MTSAWTRETPIGVLTLTEEAGALTGVLFGPDAPEGALRMETPLIQRAFAQLEEYFRGERKAFDLPHGRAWHAVSKALLAGVAGNPLRTDAHLCPAGAGRGPVRARIAPWEWPIT